MLEISTSVKVCNNIANSNSTEVCSDNRKLSRIAGLVALPHHPSALISWAEDGKSKKKSRLFTSQHESFENSPYKHLNRRSNTLPAHFKSKQLHNSSLERSTPKVNNRHPKGLMHAVITNEVEEEAKDEDLDKHSERIIHLTQLHDSLQKHCLPEIKASDKLVGSTASTPSLSASGGGRARGSLRFHTPNNNTMSQKSSSSFVLPLQRASAKSGDSGSSATSTVVSPLLPTASVATKSVSPTVAVKIPPQFDTASSSSATSTTSDVTSSGSSSPPAGITKLETLDFTASQDAFDDLASIVGISMGADSTVPNMDGDLDLDAWIENTAQNIKPLVTTLADSSSGVGGCNNNSHGTPINSGASCSSNSLDIQTLTAVKQSSAFSMITTHHQSMMPVAAAAAAAALIGGSSADATSAPSSSTPSTLQSLLQGSLSQSLPCTNGVVTGQQVTKMTQLQQRDLQIPVTAAAAAAAAAAASSANHSQLPPPPYSILQNRLQLGPVSTSNRIQNKLVGSSSFEMMKQLPPASSQPPPEFTPSSSVSAVGPFGGASSAADSLPHSTNGSGDLVTGSSSCTSAAATGSLVQRRLGEMAAAAAVAHSLHSKLKHPSSKQSAKMRHKLSGGSSTSPRTAASDTLSAASIDHSVGTGGKKMMHHCQICNRGFLNKSNIKVHLRTHTGEKPFKCEHCSKAFRQKAHLLKHMSIHKRISRD